MRLQIKVPLLVIAILFVIGITSGGMVLSFQRQNSINQFRDMATALAGAVQGSLEQNMLTGERRYIQEAIIRVSAEEMVSKVAVYTPQGTVAASSEVSEIGKRADIAEVSRALQSGQASTLAGQSGRKELWIITPVFNSADCYSCHSPQNRVLGAIKVSLDTTPLDNQTRQQTVFIAALGGLTFLIIGVGLSLALKRAILNPLTGLAATAQRLSRGDYSGRARSDRDDEIGMLASAFNEMAASVEQRSREIEASRDELARWNQDLEEKIAQRTRELSTLNAVISAVSRSLDLDRIIHDALGAVLAVANIDGGAIHLLDEKTGKLEMLAHRGLSAAHINRMAKLSAGKGMLEQVMHSGKPGVINEEDGKKKAAARWNVKFQSYISLPVSSSSRELGTLSLASRTPARFDAATVRLLAAVSEAIGIAVEQARAARQVEEANKIREHLLEKLIVAQEDERRRIARELHDEASQSLAALALNLESVAESLPPKYRDSRQKLGVLKEHAIATLGGIRNLALELRPSALDDLGLPLAIDWYAKDYLRKRGLEVKVEVIGHQRKLPSYTETIVFRIVQEALTNVVKHAGATAARVRLEFEDARAVLEVTDDGRGFDAAESLRHEGFRQNLGIHGMAERAALLGGTFAIRSQPGQGTCIHVELPIIAEEIAPDERPEKAETEKDKGIPGG